MDEIVSFVNVSKRYHGLAVIDNVSFEIEKGSVTTLIGPNGAGKTTIARLMLGIDTPSDGVVTKHATRCSYIPQKILLNGDLPLDVQSLVKCLTKNKATHNVNIGDFADLENFAHKSLHELSGGQLQKVLIATAMLSMPDLMVLDEPTQGLDIQSQNDLYLLLENIRSNCGVTIFMISHDLHTVMTKSDKVLCLNHHICCSGKPKVQKGSTLSQIGVYTHHHDHVH